MTDYGLRLKNSSNGIQIDSTYKNLSVLSSSSLTLPSSWTGNLAEIDITNVSKDVVFFWRPITTNQYINHHGFNYTSTEVDKVYFHKDEKSSGVEGQTIYYRFYYLGMVSAKPMYGIAVYNSSGTQVFNNNNSFLRLIVHLSTLNYSIDPTADNYVDVVVSDASNNYFMLLPFNWCLANNDGAYYSSHCLMGMKKINSTTIRVGQTRYGMEEVTNLYDYTKWTSAITLLEAIT